jgi:hypothetical protein
MSTLSCSSCEVCSAMPRCSRFVAGLAALGAAAALLLPAAPAAAATHCTGWGALPVRVALHQNRTVVRITLTGSTGCHDQRTDNGATATMVDPTGRREDMRWRHFGGVQSMTMYVNLVHSGSYRLRNGNVQVYDRRYERVPWSWHRTSMIVKRAAHFSNVAASGGVVSGRAFVFTKYGWSGYRGKRVYVLRRAVGSPTWHTLGSTRAAAHGVVRYRTATSSGYVYRLVLNATPSVWNARSAQVRG